MSRTDIARTGRSIADLARDTLIDAEDHGRVLLRRTWLGTVARELREARRRAGLSQAEVAARLGTTQSAIARLERDRDGSFNLRKLVDYALAVDAFPYDIELAPFDDIHQYAVADPGGPRDAVRVWTYHLWQRLDAEVAAAAAAAEPPPVMSEQTQGPVIRREEPKALPAAAPSLVAENTTLVDDDCAPSYPLAA